MRQQSDTEDSSANDPGFQNKVWTTAAIFAFMVIVLLLMYSTFKVLLFVLAGSLIAIFFRALSSKIQSRTL